MGSSRLWNPRSLSVVDIGEAKFGEAGCLSFYETPGGLGSRFTE